MAALTAPPGIRVLVANAGSSSLKLRVLDGEDVVVASWDLTPDDELPGDIPVIDAVGHRVVHGGTRYRDPVVVDDAVRAELEKLVDLAPLHQPKSLRALDRLRQLFPGLPHVACFDTAFHGTMPLAAATYALPQRWRERYPIHRYGFHGLSHSWATRRGGELVPGVRRLVTCHLGAGASLAAVVDGRSVDTTMGFTPLEGVAMATRSGSVDPGLVLWLQTHEGLTADEVSEALERESGLTGLAGTGDVRRLLERNDAEARLALDVYVHRITGALAQMTASAGGLDAVVFTGGVGENSAEIRRRVAERLSFLGLGIDDSANNSKGGGDRDISVPDARVRTLVVHSREDREIARGVRDILAAGEGRR